MALEIIGWDALRELRMRGMRPSLPVILTSKAHLIDRLQGVGCMVILHKAGESPPVKLLDGLDVIAIFDTCKLAARFIKFAGRHGVGFTRYRAWCSCGKILTVVSFDCESYACDVKWFEGQGKLA